MAIYNIFDYGTLQGQKEEQLFIPEAPKAVVEDQGGFFSALAARLFFFILLLADLVWGAYSFVALVVKLALSLITFNRLNPLKESLQRTFLSFKRSVVCALALIVALFSPALGIMFSCMYFLMYDKNGVDEIVPSSLRDQFKDIIPSIQ
jgi:predicted PurR-regulated permease PerM